MPLNGHVKSELTNRHAEMYFLLRHQPFPFMVCPQGKGTADALDLRCSQDRGSESVSLESGLAKTWPTEMKGVDLATENEIGVV